MTVGWFNLQHADKPLRLIPAFDNDQDLNWSIAAGLLRPDDKPRARVDQFVDLRLQQPPGPLPMRFRAVPS
jgi:polar amino acid transport system substrate-binding protein